MKIYNAYYYEYIPGYGDSQRNHIASYTSFEVACDKVREWIRENILCDELHLDLDDGLSDEEIEAAYNKAYDEIEKYLAENRKEYDLDKWTQHNEWDGGGEYCREIYYSRLEEAKHFIEHNWDPIEKPERKVVWRGK